jgi:Chaperonin 10 Kd subunit.
MMESKVLTACKGKVLVTNLDSGEQKTAGGIVLSDDDGKLRGIHSRWAKVYSVGEGIVDIQEGEWILVEHGRWSRTITVDGIQMNLVDYPKGVLCASPDRPKGFIGLGK